MGIFERLFRRATSGKPSEARALLLPFLDEAREYRCEDHPRFVAIAAAPAEVRAEVVTELARIFLPEGERFRRQRDIVFRPCVVTLWKALLGDELPLDEARVVVLIDGLARGHVANIVTTAITGALEQAIADDAVSSRLRDALDGLVSGRPGAIDPALRRQLERIGVEVPDVAGTVPLPPEPEPAKTVNPIEAWLGRLPSRPVEVADWTALLEHGQAAAGKSKPSQRFLRDGTALADAVGRRDVDASLRTWMESIDLGEKGIPDDQREVLKGLLWIIGAGADEALIGALTDFAQRCFKKIPEIGPASTKLGNAAVFALGRASGPMAVAGLAAVASKVRYASARRQIDRVLDDAARRTGVSRDELEEMSVPDFGLAANGTRQTSVGNYNAEISLAGEGASLQWRNERGKALKTMPSALRKEHPDEVAALRRAVKEIDAVASAQLTRIEGLWLAGRVLDVGTLRARYLEHMVVGFYARRLVWSVELEGRWQPALFRDGGFSALGEAVAVRDATPARLWHPIELESTDEVSVWRDWLAELGVVQPFSQLYRDTYRAGDASRPDERFAGHILMQKALREQCRRHGWHYQLQGYWDSANSPMLELPHHGLYVAFDADPIEHRGDDHAFEYLISGAVHFYSERDPELDGSRAEVRGSDVDPLVFSEAMRGIGAMIAASTITSDPGFEKSGPGASWSEYWQRGAWGALAPAALARRAVVADMLPRTTLRDVAELDDRWLIVEGAGGKHRIHVGSGLVRSDESGELVKLRVTPAAKRAAEAVFLPFEGDAMLRKVLARAFMLARA